MAQHRAALAQRQLLAGLDGGLDPEILLVDGVEIACLIVDLEPRQRAAAMHLRQQRAADRNLDPWRRAVASLSAARRNCGGKPVYSGGVSHRSKVATTPGMPPSKLGDKRPRRGDRASRPRHR